MNKIEMIKSLYEELSDVQKMTIRELLNNYDEKTGRTIDFYSDDFIEFVKRANDFREQMYLFECGDIKRIYNEFDNYDEAEKYYVEHFENVMKARYAEDSDEYQCFVILTDFSFSDVEEACRKLGYTYGVENRPITAEKLIEDAVDMLRDLCSNDDAKFRQIGRLHTFKINYPKEDGGNYFSLLFCIESYDNAF